jgi:hypothetical protein
MNARIGCKLSWILAVVGLVLAGCASPDRQIDPGKIRVISPVSGPIVRIHVIRPSASLANTAKSVNVDKRIVGYWNSDGFDKKFGARVVQNLEMNGIKATYQGANQASDGQPYPSGVHVLVIQPTQVTFGERLGTIYKVSVRLSSPGIGAAQLVYEDELWDAVDGVQKYLATDKFTFSLLNLLRDQQLIKWSGDFKVGDK